jgi:hypothetical protein
MRWLAIALLATVATAASAPATELQRSRSQRPAVRTVVVYSGTINARTAERFLDVISSNTDKVIGLNVTVEITPESEPRYGANFSEGRLVISSGDPMDAPQEVVINGPVGTTMGLTRVDGFYLIKSGGMHAAGALSWGAMPVDEASLRLNPYVRIVHRSF